VERPPQVLPPTPELIQESKAGAGERQKEPIASTHSTIEQQSSPPGDNASGEARESGAQIEEEMEEGLRTTFRKRRIDFKTLPRPLLVLLRFTLAQVWVVALLLATQTLPQPLVRGSVDEQGQIYVVPLAAFIVLVVLLIAAIWIALAGALRVRWDMRFLVIALVTWLLTPGPLNSLTANAGLRGEPFVTEARLRWAQLALVALIWLGAASLSLLGKRAQPKGTASPSESRPWHGWVFGLTGVPILLYYGLELVIWLVYANASFLGAGSEHFLYDIGFQTYFLPSSLLLLVYWYSTDLLEWGGIIANSILAATLGVPRLLVTVTVLAAGAMLVNELRINGWRIFLGLAIVAVIMVLVALVVRFARIRSDWPAHIPALALLLGAVVLYLQFAVISEVTGHLVAAHGLVAQEIVVPLSTLAEIPVLLVALTFGLVLVARGRLGKLDQSAVGLFLVMVVLLDAAANLPDFLKYASLPVGILQQPYSLFAGLKFFAAVGALVWIGPLLVRRRSLTEANKQLSSAFFLLLAGLQVIDWLIDLTNGITTLGARSTVLAGLFVLTTLWDLVTSGEQTNKGTPPFPREGRVLLYLGYTLATISLLLYTGTLRAQTTGAPAPSYLSTSSDLLLGLFFLGAPVVVLQFLLRVGRRIPRAAEAAVPQPAGRVSPWWMQLGIGGSGMLALVVVIAFLVASALPRLIQTSQVLPSQAYTAPSPGPGCAPKGTLWADYPDAPISLHCLPKGTQITALPKKFGSVGFLSPEIWHIQNYRVSVQVDFSRFLDGCVSILTRFSGTAYYEHALCADGTWELGRSSDTFTTLAQGQAALARTNTLEAATNGSQQSLTINGIQKASVTDSTSTAGSIQLGVFNKSTRTKSVVLSDFVFTPLPHRTSTAASPFSVPSSAVLAFREPLTSPGRWKNQPADARGTICQFVQGGYQVQVRQKDWIGDCGGVGHRDYTNFVFEVHMKIVAGDCGGIDFRQTNQSLGYYFLVCQNGTYALFEAPASGKIAVIANGASSFISSGVQAENLIAVVANGTRLDFYANHQQIYGTNDSTYSHGLMDISAATLSSTLTQVVYWDASVWTL
jgi:hypothetical protein